MLDPTTYLRNRSRQRRIVLSGLLLTTGLMTAVSLAAEYQNPFAKTSPQRLPAVTAQKSPDAKPASKAAAIRTVEGLFGSFSPGERVAQVSAIDSLPVPELNPAQGVSLDEKRAVADAKVINVKPNIIVQPELIAKMSKDAGPRKVVESNQDLASTTQRARSSIGPDAPVSWLRSTTSSAAHEVSRRLLSQASHEYSVGAWLSAETSAWDALRWAAESIEISRRENPSLAANELHTSTLENLTIARHAIREARDFAGHHGTLDVHTIRRMVMSHQTKLLENQRLDGMTASDAVDRYLDDARVRLSRIAAQSIEAAEAMDLLAAIYLGRGDARTLPSSTALCLRRAALQGQPMNASLAARLGMHLADLGLFQEARWALEHSLSIQPDANTANSLAAIMRKFGEEADAQKLMASIPSRQTNRSDAIPDITQLTPKQFASVSKPVMQVSARSASSSASLASDNRQSISKPSADEISEKSEQQKPNLVRRVFDTVVKKFW